MGAISIIGFKTPGPVGYSSESAVIARKYTAATLKVKGRRVFTLIKCGNFKFVNCNRQITTEENKQMIDFLLLMQESNVYTSEELWYIRRVFCREQNRLKYSRKKSYERLR